MSKRPIGISLLCGFFGLLGLAAVVGTLSSVGGTAPPGASQSVQLFLTIAPVFLVGLGGLGITVAVALWVAHPFGRSGGILFIVLWLSSETIIWLWALSGPAVVRANSSGMGIFLRFLLGGAISYYLLTVGGRYVTTEPARPQP